MSSMGFRRALLAAGCAVLAIGLAGAAPAKPEAAAAPAGPPTVTGLREIGGIGGPTRAPVLRGDRLYLTAGRRFEILDQLGAAAPRLLGSLLFPGAVGSPELDSDGRRAYLLGGVGNEVRMSIVDVSDARAPRLLGHYPIIEPSAMVRVAGSLAYIATYANGLVIVDVSDPAAPVRRGAYPVSPDTPIRDLRIIGDRAYLLADRLMILDVSNPAAPALLGALAVAGCAEECLEVSGGLAYVAGGSLSIIDVSDPTQPTLRGALGAGQQGGSFTRLRVVGARGYAMLETGANDPNPQNPRLFKLALADPARPAFDGAPIFPATYGAAVLGLHANAQIVVVTDSEGLQTFDPARDLQRAGHRSALRSPQQIVWVGGGGLAYVRNEKQLYLYDLSNPALPIERGKVADDVLSLAIQGSALYAADWNSKLRTFDVSDPAQPRLAATRPWIEDSVYAAGGKLYGQRLAKLVRADIAAPLAPAFVGESEPLGGDPTWRLSVDGALGVLGSYGSGLRAVDLSVSPPAVHPPYGLDLQGWRQQGRMVFAWSWRALSIIDIGDPAGPRLVGSYPAPPNPGYRITSFALDGQRAAITFQYGSSELVDILDLSDLAQPRLMHREIATDAYQLKELRGNLLYAQHMYPPYLRIFRLEGLPPRVYLPLAQR